MAKAHWTHDSYNPETGQSVQRHGCQQTECEEPATHGWQRTATEEEIEAESVAQGPFGEVIRNWDGPHKVAVFACGEHVLPLDSMAATHLSRCPAPDLGCECHDGE